LAPTVSGDRRRSNRLQRLANRLPRVLAQSLRRLDDSQIPSRASQIAAALLFDFRSVDIR
jgi:hypothetical protein